MLATHAAWHSGSRLRRSQLLQSAESPHPADSKVATREAAVGPRVESILHSLGKCFIEGGLTESRFRPPAITCREAVASVHPLALRLPTSQSFHLFPRTSYARRFRNMGQKEYPDLLLPPLG